MTSTDLKTSLTNNTRPSSRVLKPPGGGHTNIFGEPEVAINQPRPKYNQQNSSNLNACMGSDDANKILEQTRENIVQTKTVGDEQVKTDVGNGQKEPKESATNGSTDGQAGRNRVPPGGFSSGGFW